MRRSVPSRGSRNGEVQPGPVIVSAGPMREGGATGSNRAASPSAGRTEVSGGKLPPPPTAQAPRTAATPTDPRVKAPRRGKSCRCRIVEPGGGGDPLRGAPPAERRVRRRTDRTHFRDTRPAPSAGDPVARSPRGRLRRRRVGERKLVHDGRL